MFYQNLIKFWRVFLFIYLLQAKSPVRSLDELSVTELPSTPYFPPLTERTWSNPNNGDPLACSSQPKTETAGVTTNGDTFGIRKRHRCYVITARSRGFLYHQVWFISIPLSLPSLGTSYFVIWDTLFKVMWFLYLLWRAGSTDCSSTEMCRHWRIDRLRRYIPLSLPCQSYIQ